MTDHIDLLILERIANLGSADTYELSKECEKDHQIFVGAVKRLQSLGNVSVN